MCPTAGPVLSIPAPPSLRTDLPEHIGCHGERGPDGRVDAKEDQPEQHASPDRQVTELSRSRERRRVSTARFPLPPHPQTLFCSGLCQPDAGLSAALGLRPVAQVV